MTEKLDVPRYLAALMKLAGEPGVHRVEVPHDDWCAHWQGRPCNCDFDDVVKPAGAGQ